MLAEQVINDERDNLPVIIFRPSIGELDNCIHLNILKYPSGQNKNAKSSRTAYAILHLPHSPGWYPDSFLRFGKMFSPSAYHPRPPGSQTCNTPDRKSSPRCSITLSVKRQTRKNVWCAIGIADVDLWPPTLEKTIRG